MEISRHYSSFEQFSRLPVPDSLSAGNFGRSNGGTGSRLPNVFGLMSWPSECYAPHPASSSIINLLIHMMDSPGLRWTKYNCWVHVAWPNRPSYYGLRGLSASHNLLNDNSRFSLALNPGFEPFSRFCLTLWLNTMPGSHSMLNHKFLHHLWALSAHGAPPARIRPSLSYEFARLSKQVSAALHQWQPLSTMCDIAHYHEHALVAGEQIRLT